VQPAIGELERHRGIGPDVGGLRHLHGGGSVIGTGVRNEVGQAAIEDPLAVGLLERHRVALADAEGLAVPTHHVEYLLGRGDAPDERHVHPEELPDGVERQLHARALRYLTKPDQLIGGRTEHAHATTGACGTHPRKLGYGRFRLKRGG
jgi:hypothetical protein